MPKFFYILSFLSLSLWSFVVAYINGIRPNSLGSILAFIVLIFLTFGVTAAIPLFFIWHKKRKDITSSKFLGSKSLKWGFFFSFGITGVAFMKAFSLLNLVTLPLYLALYIVLFFQIRGNR
jgi:hypothetical protein